MKLLTLLCFLLTATLSQAQPPYSGTIFIDPDIITPSDPSALQSTTYAGRGWAWTFDRRTNNWGWMYAYLFNVVWDDGITSVAQVNPEFSSVSAATVEAQKYAFLIGQLPACLRTDVDEIWIHKGTQPFGGGNNSILIHTGQATQYENSGILEETLVHEATHTSLDATHANAYGWLSAQNQDNNYISTYAQSNPTTEDVAESFLTWMAVRYRQAQLSSYDFYTILYTIPNRLAYFDGQNFDLYPFHSNTSNNYPTPNTAVFSVAPTISLYPNPTKDIIYIEGVDLDKEELSLYNTLGQDLTPLVSSHSNGLDLSNLPDGNYILKATHFAKRVSKIGGKSSN